MKVFLTERKLSRPGEEAGLGVSEVDLPLSFPGLRTQVTGLWRKGPRQTGSPGIRDMRLSSTPESPLAPLAVSHKSP